MGYLRFINSARLTIGGQIVSAKCNTVHPLNGNTVTLTVTNNGVRNTKERPINCKPVLSLYVSL